MCNSGKFFSVNHLFWGIYDGTLCFMLKNILCKYVLIVYRAGDLPYRMKTNAVTNGASMPRVQQNF